MGLACRETTLSATTTNQQVVAAGDFGFLLQRGKNVSGRFIFKDLCCEDGGSVETLGGDLGGSRLHCYFPSFYSRLPGSEDPFEFSPTTQYVAFSILFFNMHISFFGNFFEWEI